jgi:23S rRNA (uracil1939-C5)-methyltransferase
VVVDPPRAGAEAQARSLAKSKVKRVVMVSCDVMAFARDAAILVAGGYQFKSVTPVDQFKWTGHLEMVGLFER